MSQACVHRKFEGDQVECQCQESGFSYHDLILSYHQVEIGGGGRLWCRISSQFGEFYPPYLD